MSADEPPPPEPDRVEGAPHPRETAKLYGQPQTEAQFLDAHAGGRMHHAWLLSGPRGVGKATLAYRIARFMLSRVEGGGLFGGAPATSLQMPPDHPVFRRIAAQSEPGLFVLRRPVDPKTNKLRTVTTIDEVRALKRFFNLSVADGGWRVAIVDAAEEMNVPAANAILKILEEPPAKTIFMLVSHAPARLLPTIRSRCRALNAVALGADDLACALNEAAPDGFDLCQSRMLAALSGGSAGEALRLISTGGVALYAEMIGILARAPRLDRMAIRAFAAGAAARTPEAAARYDAIVALSQLMLARLARAGALGARAGPNTAPEEAALAARLSSGPAQARIWAELAPALGASMTQARAVNLDPAQTILDMFLQMESAAERAMRAAA